MEDSRTGRGAPGPTWQQERERRSRALRAVVEVTAAVVVVAALGTPSLLWLPLVVAVPAGCLAGALRLRAALWRRAARDGAPVVRAGVPRRLSAGVADPPALPEVLCRGVLLVTGTTWRWTPARTSAPGLAAVVWDDDNLLDVTMRPTWNGLLPPHAHVTIRCPQGPVTVLVHDADRLGLGTWRARRHERIR